MWPFEGNTLDFKVDGITSFEVPLGNISRSATSKNEVTIEFHQNDDTPVSLVELRFHIPSDSTSETDPVAVSDFVCLRQICMCWQIVDNKSNSTAGAMQVEAYMQKQLKDHLQFRKLKCC